MPPRIRKTNLTPFLNKNPGVAKKLQMLKILYPHSTDEQLLIMGVDLLFQEKADVLTAYISEVLPPVKPGKNAKKG